jgi:RHS repeat-associated protein
MYPRQQQHIISSFFVFFVLLLQSWTSVSWADPDVIAQNYASAESPGIQSCTAGYGLLAGDVGYSKTQIQGALPYTLGYRGGLRGNLSNALVMESQEESTSGWTDNYQSYVTTINFGYTISTYTLNTPTASNGSNGYSYSLTSSLNSVSTTQMSIYFVQLPGESVVTAFKDEITNHVETFTRLYSADPAADIQTASSSGAGIDALAWSSNLGEYTFTHSGSTITIVKSGVSYTIASSTNTISTVPAYSNSTYVYYDNNGNGQLQTNNATAPAGSLSNAAIYGVVNASAETTTFQRVTGVTYPNGKTLTLVYDTNNNLTKVSDNRNNVLTLQHTFKINPAATTQTLNESRVVTQATLASGTLGDQQTAVFTWNTYNVLEPATGNTVAVFSLASSSSPIAGSYTYTNQLISLGATYPYISNEAYYKTLVQNHTNQPLTAYTFPILKQVINSASQIEQQWNITQNYAVALSSTTGLYYNSTATTTLESLRPAAGGAASAMDMTTVYNDVASGTIANTITMHYSPDGTQTATTTVTTVINSPTDATLNVSGAPCLSVGGKPISSAEFNTSTNRMVNFTDAKAVKSVYTYDTSNRVLTATQASGTPQSRVTTYTYATTNKTSVPNTVTAPEMTVTNTINARGQITQQTKSYPTSPSSSPQTWKFFYNETTTATNYGLLYYYEGPAYSSLNDIESYIYDNYGNVLQHNKNVNNAAGTATSHPLEVYGPYNSAGQPSTVTYADGSKDVLTYDTKYRLLSKVHSRAGLSQTVSTSYDALERPITSTDADGHTSTTSYDGVGRPSVVTDPRGNKTTTSYFPSNSPNVVIQTNPQGAVVAESVTTLDGNGRVYTKRQGSTNRLWVAMTYDANGNVIQTRTALGIINSWTYDTLNRVISHTDGNGKVDTKTYDDVDNNINENAANSAGSARGFIYRNLMQTDNNTDFGQKTYAYDLDGHMKSRLHVDRNCAFGIVDQLSRPQNTICNTTGTTSAGLQVNETYGYDGSAFGNLDSVTSNLAAYGVNTSYTYDGLNRVTGKTQTNLATPTYGFTSSHQKVSYSYTVGGRTTSMTYPSGNIINYAYDTNGALNSIKLGTNAIASNITFDGANRLTGWTWGTTSGAFTLGIDDGNIVNSAKSTNSSSTVLFNETYSYDVDGRLTSKVLNPSSTYKYSYDSDSQLLSETFPNSSSATYTYDTNGNRLTLATSGTTGLPYTAAAYTYAGNRLNTWSKNGTAQTVTRSAQGELSSTYKGLSQYDYAGRRRSESANPSYANMYFDYNHNNERTFRAGAGLDRQYACDESSHLIGEYNGNGVMIVEYVWLNDRPIAAIYAGNRIVYLITDNQSKPRRGVDASTQQVVWSWDPDAFGVLQPATGLTNGVEMDLRFPGQYYDVQSGLYYNHNRYYNPELGRYMEPDPTGLEAGLNPYSYVSNNPVNAVDPSGLMELLGDGALSGVFGDSGGSSFGGSLNFGGGGIGGNSITVGGNSANGWNLSIGGNAYSSLGISSSSSGYGGASAAAIGYGPSYAATAPYSSAPNNLSVNTYQVGFAGGVTAALGIGAGGYFNAGIAADSHGNVSGYFVLGGGGAAGTPSAFFGGHGAYSNADNVDDLSGKFYNTSLGGGLGPDVTIDGFTGTDSNHKTISGGGATIGGGAGGGSVTGGSYTWLTPKINIPALFRGF